MTSASAAASARRPARASSSSSSSRPPARSAASAARAPARVVVASSSSSSSSSSRRRVAAAAASRPRDAADATVDPEVAREVVVVVARRRALVAAASALASAAASTSTRFASSRAAADDDDDDDDAAQAEIEAAMNSVLSSNSGEATFPPRVMFANTSPSVAPCYFRASSLWSVPGPPAETPTTSSWRDIADPVNGVVIVNATAYVTRGFADASGARSIADLGKPENVDVAKALGLDAIDDSARSVSHWSPYDRVGVLNADP